MFWVSDCNLNSYEAVPTSVWWYWQIDPQEKNIKHESGIPKMRSTAAKKDFTTASMPCREKARMWSSVLQEENPQLRTLTGLLYWGLTGFRTEKHKYLFVTQSTGCCECGTKLSCLCFSWHKNVYGITW